MIDILKNLTILLKYLLTDKKALKYRWTILVGLILAALIFFSAWFIPVENATIQSYNFVFKGKVPVKITSVLMTNYITNTVWTTNLILIMDHNIQQRKIR